MKRKLLFILMLILALGLVACGGGADEPADTGAADTGAADTGSDTGAADTGSDAEGSIAVLLPDSASSARWEADDRRFFEQAFDAAGVEYTIVNAEGDARTQQTQAEQAITNGAKVILLVNLDSGSGAAIIAQAREADVKVIDYDRLTIEGPGADIYVSFDNVSVGRLMGETLEPVIDGLGVDNPQVVQLNGSPTDNNATLFREGYFSVASPRYDAGDWTLVDDQAVPDWDNQQALVIFEQILTAAGGNVDAVFAANDGLAGSVIAALKGQGLGQVPVSGQDATVGGIQNILAGDQTMTVYKPIKLEAGAAAEAAIALLRGDDVSALTGDTLNNGTNDVPFMKLTPIAVTKENIAETVIADGFRTWEEICVGDFAQYCPDSQSVAPVEETSDLSGTAEIFSWWTGGGEAAGLEAMIEVFKAEYPNIEFVNAAVAGGAGTNARAVLATRLQAGDPPGSWQGHAGQELIGTYVAAGQLESLNFLYEEEGWFDVMPETLIPLMSKDGEIYSVPVNIHRANVLWNNPTILADNGIDAPASLEEWFAAMDTLQENGMDAPLALGEQWTVLHLFETVLLASLGPDGYEGLWNGGTDWASSEVTQALDDFAKVLTYVNSDASALSWQDAAQLVIDGDAAFNVMGDWAEGFFREVGMAPNVDYGWTAVPGTGGNFQFLSDSFVLPIGAPDRDATIAWLKVAGSQAGQDAFNPVKGSIPARTDGDRSLYGEYLLSAMEDWSSNTVVGSLTHGVVANDSWKSEIDTALGLFLATQDVEGFQSALVAAYESSGK